MKSIVQKDTSRCYLCKQYENGDHLDKHHVYGGALRNKSEKYGLTVYLHHNKCHIFGERAVHQNANINHRLQDHVQRKAMKYYGWTEEDFRKLFYKSYLN